MVRRRLIASRYLVVAVSKHVPVRRALRSSTVTAARAAKPFRVASVKPGTCTCTWWVRG
jgi:hypothetical protein